MATTIDTEATGRDITRGQIITITDDLGEWHGLLTVFVLDTADIGHGLRYIDGVAVLAGTLSVFTDVILTVHDQEPVGVVGTMDPTDWSADYARRAGMPSYLG